MKNRHTKGKSSIAIKMYLSKILDKTYVALDGNIIDLSDFGISPEQFKIIGDKIQEIFDKEILT